MAKTSKRPRVFYGWWVVAASSLIAGVGSVNTMGFSVFFIPLSREIGVSRAVLS
ncbi:MAG: MFS transporter, partial [Chloroflexi bacterium]|nr:MFS transporter [Chloroflexota bacterium]